MPPPEAPKAPYTLSANVFLVSDYLFRGITLTWGKPAVQGGFDFVHDSGIYLGTWASNVSSNEFPGGSATRDKKLTTRSLEELAKGDIDYRVVPRRRSAE